jgi:hypothetical protein
LHDTTVPVGNEEVTYPAHEPSAIVSVDGAFSGMSYTANIALSPQKDRVHERLWLVQVLEKKYGYTDETEKYRQVVGDKVVGE